MSLVTCASADVLHGEIHLELRDAWLARFVLDTPTTPSGACLIKAEGGLLLNGFIVEGGVQLDAAHVFVVGGNGGLAKLVKGAYKDGKLRDPLNAIAKASGETLSSTIADDVLNLSLPAWSLGQQRAGAALDELAAFASVASGSAIGWRILSDGTIWIGAESWPGATLPDDAEVVDYFPAERRTVIAPATPALLPGVNLADVGKVVAVDHWIEPSEVRTWATV
jgi:hypothetical protein